MSIDLDPSEMPPERPERPERPSRATAGKSTTSDGAPSGTTAAQAARNAATVAKQEGELSGRIREALDRIQVALSNRNPESELAQALREDAKSMSDSLVNVTRRLPVLRKPLLWLLSVVEPVMAFGRVARIAFDRVRSRRVEGEDDGDT